MAGKNWENDLVSIRLFADILSGVLVLQVTPCNLLTHRAVLHLLFASWAD